MERSRAKAPIRQASSTKNTSSTAEPNALSQREAEVGRASPTRSIVRLMRRATPAGRQAPTAIASNSERDFVQSEDRRADGSAERRIDDRQEGNAEDADDADRSDALPDFYGQRLQSFGC